MKKLVEIAEKDDVMRLYLPKDAAQHVTKTWLVNVMNSVDPHFFDRIIEEIDAKFVEKNPAQEPKIFNIDPEMKRLIECYNKDRKLKSGSKAMSRMLQEPKKRKRKDMEKDWNLITTMESRAQIREEINQRKKPDARRKLKH